MTRRALVAGYFNFHTLVAESAWERRGFLKRWWRIYADDPRWAPPLWSRLTGVLGRTFHPHLARMDPLLLALEALPRRRSPTALATGGGQLGLSGPLFEETVAAGVFLRDPRRRDGAAYLAELHVANDRETLERFLSQAQELLEPAGVNQIILPTGLSTHLECGVLQSHFHRTPPLYTAYTPPYMAELVGLACRPLGRSQLYRAPVPEKITSGPARGPAQLQPLAPRRLCEDLLPLFVAGTVGWPGFPPVDAIEAGFLLDWISPWPVHAWLAELAGEPAGFIVLQPDMAEALRLAKGGRNPLRRAWLRWRVSRPIPTGRLLFGGVHPDAQGQGVGDQLWRQALVIASQLGWRSIAIGPLPTASPAHTFLQQRGAEPTRSYMLHRYTFR